MCAHGQHISALADMSTRSPRAPFAHECCRLTPPPQEAYSLHRKLAGAFLMNIKLKAVIPCRDILEEVHGRYTFG